MVNIKDLGIESVDTSVEELEINGATIHVKKDLPIVEKLELIAEIVNAAIDDNDFYNPALGKVHMLVKLVLAYTDIEVDEEDYNVFYIYDIFSNGVFQKVIPIVANTPDYSFIVMGVEAFTKTIYEYRNSARGILKGLMADAKESNLELEEIVNKINLSPESLTMVKDVLDKLG